MFENVPADKEQQYMELYAPHMGDEMELNLMEMDKDESVWTACVRRGELGSGEDTMMTGIKLGRQGRGGPLSHIPYLNPRFSFSFRRSDVGLSTR